MSDMDLLLARSESLFDAQRARGIQSLQKRSQRAAAAHFATLTPDATKKTARDRFARYQTFCENQSIPVYPITPSIVALQVYRMVTQDKASSGPPMTQDGHCLTINQIRLATRHIWADQEDCEECLAPLFSCAGLKSFNEGLRVISAEAREKKKSGGKSAVMTPEKSKKKKRGFQKKAPTTVSDGRSHKKRPIAEVESSDDSTSGDDASEEEQGVATPAKRTSRPTPSSIASHSTRSAVRSSARVSRSATQSLPSASASKSTTTATSLSAPSPTKPKVTTPRKIAELPKRGSTNIKYTSLNNFNKRQKMEVASSPANVTKRPAGSASPEKKPLPKRLKVASPPASVTKRPVGSTSPAKKPLAKRLKVASPPASVTKRTVSRSASPAKKPSAKRLDKAKAAGVAEVAVAEEQEGVAEPEMGMFGRISRFFGFGF